MMVKTKDEIEETLLEPGAQLRAPIRPVPHKPEVEEALGETPDSVELYLNEIARYKLLRPDEEVSLAKEIENGRILDELSDAYMEEHMSAPSTEQLIERLLRQIRESLMMVRRSRVLKGFPQRGYGEQLFFEPLRESIQDHLEEPFEEHIATSTKRTMAQVRPMLITLAVAQRIFPPEIRETVGMALEDLEAQTTMPEKPVPARGKREPSARAVKEYKEAEAAVRKQIRDSAAHLRALVPYVQSARYTSQKAE